MESKRTHIMTRHDRRKHEADGSFPGQKIRKIESQAEGWNDGSVKVVSRVRRMISGVFDERRAVVDR